MVGASLDRSWARPGMDYRSADDLLRSWLHLAEPRANFARRIAANGIERLNRRESLRLLAAGITTLSIE